MNDYGRSQSSSCDKEDSRKRPYSEVLVSAKEACQKVNEAKTSFLTDEASTPESWKKHVDDYLSFASSKINKAPSTDEKLSMNEYHWTAVLSSPEIIDKFLHYTLRFADSQEGKPFDLNNDEGLWSVIRLRDILQMVSTFPSSYSKDSVSNDVDALLASSGDSKSEERQDNLESELLSFIDEKIDNFHSLFCDLNRNIDQDEIDAFHVLKLRRGLFEKYSEDSWKSVTSILNATSSDSGANETYMDEEAPFKQQLKDFKKRHKRSKVQSR